MKRANLRKQQPFLIGVNILGFELYGPYHIGWLIATVIVVCVVCAYYRRATIKNRQRTKWILTLSIVIGELIKDIYIAVTSTISVEELPLSLCGLAMFALLIYSGKPNEVLGNMLYCLFLPGAISAMLFCNWTDRPIDSFLSLFSFFYHIVLIVYITMILAAKEFTLHPRHLWASVLFLLISAPLIYRFNKHYDTNFMFLNTPSPGSPLVPLENIFGNPGYIFGLVLVLIGVWIIFYIPFFVRKIMPQKK